jgi:lysophospholipid acyltransferase (LPLAT)-like uncharacterized protein
MLRGRWQGLKKKVLPYCYAYLGKYAVKLLLWSCKIHIEGLERFVQHASEEKCILMLWHNRLALAAEILHRYAPQFIYAAVISNSHDADPLFILAYSYKSGKAIRVPHNARHQALKQIINNLKKKREVIVITPDGPRGPCYKVKPGIAFAAKETEATIIPLTWTATRFWQFRTWDKFMLPKPFSSIRVTLGHPIKSTDAPSALNVYNLDILTRKLQDSMPMPS